jgi:hypothetical protein
MNLPSLLLIVATSSIPAMGAVSFQYAEDFSTGLNGWSTAGSSGSGGPPSSLVHNPTRQRASYLDTAGGIGYYLAPSVLSGDLSGAYDGVFAFDIIVPNGMDTGHSSTNLIRMDAFIWGQNGDVLVIDLAQPTDGSAGEALTQYSIAVNDTAGWRYLNANTTYANSVLFSTLNVPQPTTATLVEMLSILNNVVQIGFRAEFSDGIDSTSGALPGTPGFNPETELDNFTFGVVPEPTGSLLAILGSIPLIFRRKR